MDGGVTGGVTGGMSGGAESAPGPEGTPTPPERLLRTFVVEDSPLILDNLIATLEEMAPVRVVGHAADEATALARLAELGDTVELVIVDVFLKSGSGLGVLRGTLNLRLPAARVVLTNYATVEMRRTCRALGADRVFDKSNDVDELLAFCSHLAERGPGDGPASDDTLN